MRNSFDKARDLWIVLGLVLIGVLVYSRVPSLDFLTIDDNEYVTENARVQMGLTIGNIFCAFSTVHATHWQPLCWLSHLLDYTLYGMNPAGHHLTNLLIHLVNVVLLFLIWKNWTGAFWRSALVALLLCVHPFSVETVCWVSARKDVLCGFFWIVTFCAYGWYARKSQSWGRYAVVIGVYTMGLMVKSTILMLPLILLLLDYWPLKRMPRPGEPGSMPALRKIWPLIREKIVFCVLSGSIMVLTYCIFNALGKIGAWAESSLWYRLGIVVTTYCKFIVKWMWPVDLCIYYPYPLSSLDAWDIVSAAGLVIGISLLAGLWVRTRPYVFVGWFWCLLAILPVVGFVRVGTFLMCDRYMYIAQIGLGVAAVWGMGEFVRQKKISHVVAGVLAGVIAVLLCLASVRQVRTWRDTESAYKQAAKVNPNNFYVHVMLGALMSGKQDYVHADPHILRAYQLKSDYAMTQYYMGTYHLRRNNAAQAVLHFIRAEQLHDRNCDCPFSRLLKILIQSQPDHRESSGKNNL